MTTARWILLGIGSIAISGVGFIVALLVGFDIGGSMGEWVRDRRPLSQLIEKTVRVTNKKLPKALDPDWTFVAVEPLPMGLRARMSTTAQDQNSVHDGMARLLPDLSTRFCGHSYTQSIFRKGGTLELHFESSETGLSKSAELNAQTCGLVTLHPSRKP
jgi:hypothetical protein